VAFEASKSLLGSEHPDDEQAWWAAAGRERSRVPSGSGGMVVHPM